MTTARDLTPRLRRRGLQAAFGVYLVALALVVFLPSKEASTVTGWSVSSLDGLLHWAFRSKKQP